MTETAMPNIIANHNNIRTYWYSTCWLISHTNLYSFITAVLISFADSCTSQKPKVGNSALPGFGKCRIPAEKANVDVNMKYECIFNSR